MAVRPLDGGPAFALSLAFGALVVIASVIRYLFYKPPFKPRAPEFYNESVPLLGSWQFFTSRWEFWQRGRSQSKTHNFTFYAGQWPVVGLCAWGESERKLFFDSKALDFAEGYGALLAGSPEVKKDNNLLGEKNARDASFNSYFAKRIVAMLKGNRLKKGLPQLLADARMLFDQLAADHAGIINPFDSIYAMVFHFTMRTVACNEIANDPPLLAKCLRLFEAIEKTATPLSIMWPWMPLWAKVRRTYAGAQLYMILKKIVDDRNKNGVREDDCLQFLMDQGDNITDIITFVLGALFAGQINSGINAAWILCYFANSPYWTQVVREEVEGVANRYCPDKSLPLKERLMQVPSEAWEGEFPTIDLALKESIRLQMHGTAFRKNNTDQDLVMNKQGEIVPAGTYVAMAVADIHYNTEWYTNPEEWDPGRYLPDRAEDKKAPYAWIGWGAGRHPCLGMRFAKLENNIIVAFWMAYFADVQLTDQSGKPRGLTPSNKNFHSAHKPEVPMYLKFKPRKD